MPRFSSRDHLEITVLPLAVVDNSAFSPNRLTVLSTLFILPL